MWLITAVIDGQAVLTTAHVLDAAGRQFRQVPAAHRRLGALSRAGGGRAMALIDPGSPCYEPGIAPVPIV